MQTYWALVAFIVKGYGERHSDIEFEALGPVDAIRDAVRFARNRERTFEDWTFVCVKVGEFRPGPIGPDGMLLQAHCGNFFEWKYDWPGTLEERIQVFGTESKR
jgi:hypothetical protein